MSILFTTIHFAFLHHHIFVFVTLYFLLYVTPLFYTKTFFHTKFKTWCKKQKFGVKNGVKKVKDYVAISLK